MVQRESLSALDEARSIPCLLLKSKSPAAAQRLSAATAATATATAATTAAAVTTAAATAAAANMGDCELLRRACPRSFIAPFLQRRVRPDGRRLAEVRSVEIVAGGPSLGPPLSAGGPRLHGGPPTKAPLAAAHASASVRAGGDWWISAVECKLGPPVSLPPCSSDSSCSSSSSDSSKSDRWGGKVLVVVDMPRICGCPQEDTLGSAREVSRHLTALLNDPSIFDCSQLHFSGVPAAFDSSSSSNNNSSSRGIEFFWHIEIKVVCLQFGGSIYRVPALAAVAALGSLQLPTVEWDPLKKWWALLPSPAGAAAAAPAAPAAAAEGEERRAVVVGRRVRLQCLPVCVSACHALHSTWLLDPTAEERQLGPLVVFFSRAQGAPLATHKLQGGPLEDLVLQQLQHAAAAAAEETRQQLARAIGFQT
ncbi:hypothetical protein Emed_005450 [Eimeria media]